MKSTNTIFFATLFTAFLFGCQSVVVKEVEVKEVISAPISQKTKPVSLSKVIVKLKRGEKWGKIQGGLLCVPSTIDLMWRQGRVNVTSEIFSELFRETFEQAGYKVAGDPDDLFEKRSDVQTDYAIGGLIKDMKANICFPYSGFGNWQSVSGEAYMEVEWQIFDTLNREVVKTLKTEGSYKKKEVVEGFTAEMIVEETFAVAVNNLLADREVTDLLTSTRKLANLNKPHSLPTKISFNENKLESFQDNVTGIRASVVTVRSSSGHGSGFFISKDGYVLTNHHVVGEADYVKIILPTGREMIGDVIKTDKSRDIALVKTEQSGLSALTIERITPSVGSDVYAIGSPLKEELQNTISRGIVSGFREFNGQTYIQSDVNITFGNSGGPLINEQGNVVGVAVSGVHVGGVTTGLNFFIPIEVALTSLNVKQKVEY